MSSALTQQAGLIAVMKTLKQRLEQIMEERGWDHAALVRVSGQSSSVVSQWLGKGSKPINSIGKMEAAERIEAESGYCSLWIAKGKGPERLSTQNNVSDSAPYTVYLSSDTKSVRAPVVEWARLEAVLNKQLGPSDARSLPYELEDGVSESCFYLIAKHDNLAPDIRPGDRLLLDPENTSPTQDQVALFRVDGSFELFRYRKTISGFEAFDSTQRQSYESSKHTIEVVAACVGSFRRSI